MSVWQIAGAWAVLAGLDPVAAQAGGGLVVQVARFYRGDRTLVHGFVRVPHASLEPVSRQDDASAWYRVDVVLTDASGTVLTRESWTRRVDWAAARMQGASSVETLTFVVGAGAFGLTVTVTDSASGRAVSGETRISAYDAAPAVSDLLLADRIRPATGSDTVPEVGEVRKGGLLVAAGPDPVLRPNAAKLYVYGEAYRDRPDTVAWHLEVVGPDGKVVVATAPSRAAVEAGGGVITGGLDLAGLPPASYALRAVVVFGADTATSAADFEMGGLELERRVAQASQELGASVDAFDRASEAGLDSLFAPLFYLPDAADLRLYEGLTSDGKRRFLRAFWARRDPTPATPRNEAMEDFYARIAEANRRFAEGGAGSIPGWRTDRGRIYIVHGEPDQVLRRPFGATTPPWEAWKYLKERALKYVFLDETRLGHYALVFSDDRRERSYPNWDSVLGEEAVKEITQF